MSATEDGGHTGCLSSVVAASLLGVLELFYSLAGYHESIWPAVLSICHNLCLHVCRGGTPALFCVYCANVWPAFDFATSDKPVWSCYRPNNGAEHYWPISVDRQPSAQSAATLNGLFPFKKTAFYHWSLNGTVIFSWFWIWCLFCVIQLVAWTQLVAKRFSLPLFFLYFYILICNLMFGVFFNFYSEMCITNLLKIIWFGKVKSKKKTAMKYKEIQCASVNPCLVSCLKVLVYSASPLEVTEFVILPVRSCTAGIF